MHSMKITYLTKSNKLICFEVNILSEYS